MVSKWGCSGISVRLNCGAGDTKWSRVGGLSPVDLDLTVRVIRVIRVIQIRVIRVMQIRVRGSVRGSVRATTDRGKHGSWQTRLRCSVFGSGKPRTLITLITLIKDI